MSIKSHLELLQLQDAESLIVEDSQIINELFETYGSSFIMVINEVSYLANHYDSLGSWTCDSAAYHFTRIDGLKTHTI